MFYAFFVLIIGFLLVLSLIAVVFARKLSVFEQKAADFFTSTGETDGVPNPAPFDFLCDRVASVFLTRVNSSAKGALLGALSGEKRADRAMTRELVRDGLSEENPILKMVFDQLPKKWQNRIVDNPDYIAPAMKLLNTIGVNGLGVSNGNGDTSKLSSDYIERVRNFG